MSQSGDKIRKPLVSKSSFNSSKSGSEFEIVRSLFGIFWSENICTVFRVYLIRMLSYYAGKDSAVCKSKSLSLDLDRGYRLCRILHSILIPSSHQLSPDEPQRLGDCDGHQMMMTSRSDD